MGNSNAEKYDRKEAERLFTKAIELSFKRDNKGVYVYDFIGEVARDLGTYHMIFHHLVTRFPDLSNRLTELKQTLEANCYYNSKKGNIKEATAIVNLKANHKWIDRQHLEHDVKGNIGFKINVSDPEIKEELDKLRDDKDI